MAIVPSQCWYRTFKIECGGHSATCFVISHRERQWLVTAKHFVDAAPKESAPFVVTQHRGREVTGLKIEAIPLVEPGADISVFSLGDAKLVNDNLTLVAGADGLVLSQDVYFLGYPLPDRVKLVDSLPMVKKGIMAGRADQEGVKVWLVDGHNNPGFSGGPLVFNQGGGIGTIWNVLGVVSAYITQRVDVYGGLGGVVNANSGIVIVYDIKHALDAIDAYMDKQARKPFHQG